MLPIIIGAIALVIVLFVIVVSMRPSEFRYERSAMISAPPAAVFPHVNNLHKWQEWSPWAKLDPNAKSTYEGPEAGVGAVFAWAGNNKIGEGRMTITESRPSDFIRIKLDFLRPMKANNMAEFTFKPEGNQTKVVWAMTGKCNFMSKAFGLFMDFEKMIGSDFERGLAQIKAIVEKG